MHKLNMENFSVKRDYDSGVKDDVVFFVGEEVEKTPAYGMRTLFVTGVQPVEKIESFLIEDDTIEHIFFGANHSYNPATASDLYQYCTEWDDMIMHFIKKDYLCTLDIPLTGAEAFLEGPLTEQNNFIPQIRVPLPYTKLWNYNTMIKIDDVDFKATNPGVWCHSLHDLMDRDKFTDWNRYSLDTVLD